MTRRAWPGMVGHEKQPHCAGRARAGGARAAGLARPRSRPLAGQRPHPPPGPQRAGRADLDRRGHRRGAGHQRADYRVGPQAIPRARAERGHPTAAASPRVPDEAGQRAERPTRRLACTPPRSAGAAGRSGCWPTSWSSCATSTAFPMRPSARLSSRTSSSRSSPGDGASRRSRTASSSGGWRTSSASTHTPTTRSAR